jgi:excisionase family DNA binding protein
MNQLSSPHSHPVGEQPAFFTRAEAAEVAGISLSTLDRCIKDGQIPHKRLRGRVLIPRGPFIAWCDSCTASNTPMGVAA